MDLKYRLTDPGSVKALQVEDTLCLTGGSDGNVRLWDLRIVEDYEDRLQRISEQQAHQDPLDRIANRNARDEFDWDEEPSGITTASQIDESGPCVRTLEGHSKSVTSLYYEDGCLVRHCASFLGGASADSSVR